MKFLSMILCIAMMLFGGIATASAVTIDFEDMTIAPGGFHPVDFFVLENKGFNLTNGPAWNTIADIHVYETGNSLSASGTQELATHGDLQITSASASLFSLNSFSIGSIFGEDTIEVVGTLADSSTISQIFVLDGAPGLQTAVLNAAFTGLTEVHVLHSGTGLTQDIFNIDDIVLNETASVPEPASLLLLGTGILGLAAFRRKNPIK